LSSCGLGLRNYQPDMAEVGGQMKRVVTIAVVADLLIALVLLHSELRTFSGHTLGGIASSF